MTRRGPRFNWQVIGMLLGAVSVAVGIGMLVCAGVAVIYQDGAGTAFALTGAGAIVGGAAAWLRARRIEAPAFRPRDGYLAVTASWVLATTISSIALLACGAFDRPVLAFFESMSGFTTAGSTVAPVVEDLPHAVLLWRSLTQWLGGVGVVVLVVAIAPAIGLATQRAFYAETSGVTDERLTPRIADTAKIIWAVYLALTAVGLLVFLAVGMTGFDAINHIFSTLATGGFSTHTASIAHYDSATVELAVLVFMIAGGINFAFYWRAVRGLNVTPQWAEIRAFLGLLAVSSAAVAVSLMIAHGSAPADAIREAAFTVTSFVTTTGFVTADYDAWNDFARLTLFLLLFAGACAGSTSGGLKIIRLMLLGRAVRQELSRYLHPQAVHVLRVSGRVFGEDVRRGVMGYMLLLITIFLAGTVTLAAFGMDLLSAASGAATSLTVVGPGLGQLGATESFAAVPDGGLWTMSALMLIGRLELFTAVVLLTPAFWRRNGV